MADAVLALNAGSSSVKFALFDIRPGGLSAVTRGELEGIGTAPHFVAHDAGGDTVADQSWGDAAQDHDTLFEKLLNWVDQHLGEEKLIAVGHRVVHGGREFVAPVLLDAHVIAALDALTPLAPLHQPHSLAPVRAIGRLRPELPQVACFDTAFHHTMPPVATRFALPREFADEGVRRYGFHGLSYEYIADCLRRDLPHLARGRVVVAHLGNGASLCAMQACRSIDTTMGFTALDGLVMGTRCGAMDPGVLLYLLQQKHLSPHEVEDILYKKSGLLGVSGLSSDMRTLLASDHPDAAAAVELFVYSIARATAALTGALGGLDGFIFTAGIGEHAPAIRAAVCDRLRWLGVIRDVAAPSPGCISASGSAVAVHVIPTDEETVIGRHTLAIVTTPHQGSFHT